MADYKIVEVKTKRDLKKFITFPDKLYKGCPQYVPALHSDQVKSLTKAAPLKYCTRVMWLAMDGKKVVGRICGMINPRYNERYGKKRARFGWFDLINDIEVARLLLGTAENWAREQGMNEIHGPLYYNTLGKQGMLVEGFENLAPFKDRLAMAKLAFEHIPNVIVSDIEKDMVAPYGTWDVLGRLKMQYPNDVISLMIGGDNVINFEKWKNYQELAHTFPVICFDRTSNAADYEYFEYIVKKYNMFQIQQIPFNISSTSLRIWLKANISCLGYIPTEVLNYIHRNKLYSPSSN